MKSNATMHDLARAMAVSHGPRIIEVPGNPKTFIAICVTPEELRGLFAREGYRTDSDKHMVKVNAWEDRGDTSMFAGHAIFPMTTTVQRFMAEKLAEGHDNVMFLGME